jgi:hypothetical protein
MGHAMGKWASQPLASQHAPFRRALCPKSEEGQGQSQNQSKYAVRGTSNQGRSNEPAGSRYRKSDALDVYKPARQLPCPSLISSRGGLCCCCPYHFFAICLSLSWCLSEQACFYPPPTAPPPPPPPPSPPPPLLLLFRVNIIT